MERRGGEKELKLASCLRQQLSMVGFDGNGARSRLLPFLGALGTFPLTVAFLRFFALSPFLARGRGRVQTANTVNAEPASKRKVPGRGVAACSVREVG